MLSSPPGASLRLWSMVDFRKAAMRRNLLSFCLLTMMSALCLGAPATRARKIAHPQSPAALSDSVFAGSVRVGSLTLHRSLGGRAYCGSIERALDPTGQVGGNIKISFEFYPHTDGSQSPLEPIVATEGGPGYATTGSAGGYLAFFAPLRDQRDMLFVDNRGTGTSQALNCPLLQAEPNPRPSGIYACGKQLGDTAYLYDSGLAADDLAALLDALNIPIINLYGDSYGTWFSQTFAGRHPERLRSVVLDSPYPVRGQAPWYPEIAPTARFAFDAACKRSPACSSLPGNSLHRIELLLNSLRANPFSGYAHDGNGILRHTHAHATRVVAGTRSGCPGISGGWQCRPAPTIAGGESSRGLRLPYHSLLRVQPGAFCLGQLLRLPADLRPDSGTSRAQDAARPGDRQRATATSECLCA